MTARVLPITAVIASAGRTVRLINTLRTLRNQSTLPAELVIVGKDFGQKEIDSALKVFSECPVRCVCLSATKTGAAPQRMQAYSYATQPFILFMDDDIDLQDGCLEHLWTMLDENGDIGGVSAFISNQSYLAPRRLTRIIYWFLGCPLRGSLAGLCRGPILNFLPDAKTSQSGVIPTEWLNLTCTLYRQVALPDVLFSEIFQGYSLGEDVALSLIVARNWKLAACAKALIYHDTKPADYKSNIAVRETMDVTNRYYVLTAIKQDMRLVTLIRFLAYQFFCITLLLFNKKARGSLLNVAYYRLKAVLKLARTELFR
jgi:GT2 family glycosyltransferase